MHICTCIIPICLYVSTYPSMHPPIYKQMQPVSLPPYFVVQDPILATKYPWARPFTCSDQPSQHTTHHLHLMCVALHPRKFIHVLPDNARIGLPGAFPWVYVWTSGQQQRSTSYCHPSPTVLWRRFLPSSWIHVHCWVPLFLHPIAPGSATGWPRLMGFGPVTHAWQDTRHTCPSEKVVIVSSRESSGYHPGPSFFSAHICYARTHFSLHCTSRLHRVPANSCEPSDASPPSTHTHGFPDFTLSSLLFSSLLSTLLERVSY